MDRAGRVERYKAIEDVRGRPLIVYATSTRPGVGGQMAGDAVREFIDQLEAMEGADAVDVLIHSTGGDALAAWKLMSVLRERFDNVGVLVPYMAFSAATIFALGADEIVMHPHASLGPIDPQITIPMPDGSARRFSFEDVGAFLRFLTDEVRITEQSFLSPILDKLFSVVDPLNVGAAKRASELSSSVGERLLQLHMTGVEERANAERIAEELNKSFFAHGDAVSRTRARELNLQIAAENPEIERLIWEAYLGIEGYMQLRDLFHPLQHYLDNGGAPEVEPKPPLRLPPNAPPQVEQQLWNQVASQALGDLARPAVQVEYSVVNAVVESARLGSEFRTQGYITAARVGGGEIKLSAADTKRGWLRLQDPEPAAEDTEEGGEAE